jgi:hypothetical protein
MSQEFSHIANTDPKTPITVLSVPHGAYTQPESYNDIQNLGFYMSPALLETTVVDEVIKQAANVAGLDFLSVTDTFRQHDPLAYYPLDGHFNAEGNRLFAESIYPTVKTNCLQAFVS